MRNSYVDIRGNAPDTSDLDIGWDFEPDDVELPDDEPVFSLVPTHSSIRPSHSSVRPSRASRRANKLASQPRSVAAVLSQSARIRFAAALVAAAGVGAGAVVGFQRIHGATATEPNSAVESEPRDTARLRAAQLPTAPLPPAPPLLEAPASATETLSVVSPIVPAALPAADSASPASPERRPILVQVDPPAAAVTVDGQRLGTDLVNVELATGEHKRATIALRGYRTRVVELDSSADFVQVTLVPISRAKARSQQAAESGVDAATVDATTEPVAAAASPSSSDRQNRSPAPTSSEADAAYPQ